MEGLCTKYVSLTAGATANISAVARSCVDCAVPLQAKKTVASAMRTRHVLSA